MRTAFILMLTLFVSACEPVDKGQGGTTAKPGEIAQVLSDVATDSKQKALWQNVDAQRMSGIEALVPAGGTVRVRKPPEVPDMPVQRPAYPPLAESVTTGVHLLEMPDLDEPFDGTARLVAMQGDVLRFDLGDKRTLLLQARTGGRLFSVDQGAEVKLRLKVGDPFERDDYLEIFAGSSALAWALVGGAQPVEISFDSLGLVARQIGKPEGGSMPVEVSVGDETRTLTEFAKPVVFEKAGVSVHVLGSIGAAGDAAGVLPQDYRLEITAWPK